MKSEFTFFEKKAVIAFLGNYGKEKSKDYEFAAALVICGLCERRWGEACWIGTRIKLNHLKSLPVYNSQQEITLSGIEELLREGNDEDSLVDFVVAKRASMREAQGMIFQVKRFGIGRDKKDTGELVAYLNSFKLPQQQINLLVCLDDGVNINMQDFYSAFDMKNFPFSRLLFLWLDPNSVFLRDVLPKGETEQFLLTDIYSTANRL
jgi:hypothetical protein